MLVDATLAPGLGPVEGTADTSCTLMSTLACPLGLKPAVLQTLETWPEDTPPTDELTMWDPDRDATAESRPVRNLSAGGMRNPGELGRDGLRDIGRDSLLDSEQAPDGKLECELDPGLVRCEEHMGVRITTPRDVGLDATKASALPDIRFG